MRHIRYIDENDKAPKISKPLVVRILGYFRPHKTQLAAAILLIVLTAALGLVPTLLLQHIVDDALPTSNMRLLVWLVCFSVGTTIVLNLLRVGQSYLNTRISRNITKGIKNQMFRHLQYMPQAFFATAKPGEITTRMNSDIDGIRDVFNTTVVSLVSSIALLITSAVALFSMNWVLALVGMATLPLFVLPTRAIGKIRWKLAAKSQEKLAEMNQMVNESFSSSGSLLTKLFGAEQREYDEFQKANDEVTALQIKEMLAGRWFGMTMNIFTSIGPMLVYLVGGLLFARGQLSLGGIITFAALLGRLYDPIIQLSNIHIDFTRSFALFGRIFEYFDMPHTITDAPDAVEKTAENGEITFNNVSFAYNQDASTLQNISFTAGAGASVALVGPSGAGKTTITNLLARLYDADSGLIAVDGTDITKMSLASLRGQIGMVTQEPYLFNGSIRQNLLHARPEATAAEMEEACKAAYIHDFIAGLPQGYDTVVGNRGVKLSGGEKQRIAIARVLLKNPKIVILDEATSALDSLSEYYIQKAMVPLLRGRTSLVIAHRLSTIMNADQILVMQQGKIVQTGTHKELLQTGGLYAQLCETQFKESNIAAA